MVFLMMKVNDCDNLSYCQRRHKNRTSLKVPATSMHEIPLFKLPKVLPLVTTWKWFLRRPYHK